MSVKSTIKLQDTGSIVGEGSRLEKYWKGRGFESFYLKYRSGIKLPVQFQTVDSVDKVIKIFKLNEIGFGNWVTQEDRFNYMSALTIALYDINKICQFKNTNVGLNGMVSVSFGARGKGKALAHFEPGTFIINVTRYHDGDASKINRFIYTGGAGSMAHEYGHSLDYYFGLFVAKDEKEASLSGGHSLDITGTPTTNKLRLDMNNLLDSIIWDKKKNDMTPYTKRLHKSFTTDYWFRRNEIFARAFEKYVQVKLQRNGINNRFLLNSKYSTMAYLTDAETIAILPLFDKLMADMAANL